MVTTENQAAEIARLDDLVHRIGEERDAAQERERALVAEVARLKKSIGAAWGAWIQSLLDTYEQEQDPTMKEIWKRLLADVHKALTPKPEPESENHDN